MKIFIWKGGIMEQQKGNQSKQIKVKEIEGKKFMFQNQ